MSAAFLGGIGIWEIVVILIVALIVFGNRLPEIARQVGKGYMEFKKGLRTLENEIQYTEATPVPPKSGPAKDSADSGPAPADPEPEGPVTGEVRDGRESGGLAGKGGGGAAAAPDNPPGGPNQK